MAPEENHQFICRSKGTNNPTRQPTLHPSLGRTTTLDPACCPPLALRMAASAYRCPLILRGHSPTQSTGGRRAASGGWCPKPQACSPSALPLALTYMTPPCVLSSGYALGRAHVLRVCKHPHVSACRPTTRSRCASHHQAVPQSPCGLRIRSRTCCEV